MKILSMPEPAPTFLNKIKHMSHEKSNELTPLTPEQEEAFASLFKETAREMAKDVMRKRRIKPGPRGTNRTPPKKKRK